MTIEAKIIADSVSDSNIRLTTLELLYPRFIHAEFLTHRMFSRSSSSNRAIPTEKIINQIIENPAMPIYWGKNQAGMQANNELTNQDLEDATTKSYNWYTSLSREESYGKDLPNWYYNFIESCEDNENVDKPPKGVKQILKEEWERFAYEAAMGVKELYMLNLHKQIANRLLEPFQHIKTIVTATEWDGFFKLRLHPDAQPEIQELARCIKKAMDESTPLFLSHGEWHLPYINEDDIIRGNGGQEELQPQLIKASVARCARVSYLNHDNSSPDINKDLELAARLLKDGHLSPMEHQLSPMINPKDNYNFEKGVTHIDRYKWKWSGNVRGWYQYRQLL